jgi:hypothetical protein
MTINGRNPAMAHSTNTGDATSKHPARSFSKLDTLLIIILMGIVVASLAWSLSPSNFFRADDWYYLNKACFRSYGSLFQLLPVYVYNDRPIGAVINKLLFQIFGLNHAAFQSVFVALHLISTFLVYSIARKVLRSSFCAFAVALTFGGLYQTQGAVTWVAAIFDLSASAFMLLAIYAYLERNKWGVVLSLICYYLATRSKEFGLLLPFILIVFDFAESQADLNWQNLLAAIKRACWHFLIFTILAAQYAYLFLDANYVKLPEHAYSQVFSFAEFIVGMKFYLGRFFFPSATNQIGATITLVLFFAFTFYGLVARNRPIVCGAVCFLISIAPVLFLKNHREMLYMYHPAFYLALFVIGIVEIIGARAAPLLRMKADYFRAFACIALSILIMASLWAPLRKNSIAFNLNVTAICRAQFDFIKANFPSVSPETRFYIAGLPQYFNVFDFHNGAALTVLYRDSTIRCELYMTEPELRAFYDSYTGEKHFLRWANETLKIAD